MKSLFLFTITYIIIYINTYGQFNILSHSPNQNEIDVSYDKIPSITFNSEINSESLTNDNFQVIGSLSGHHKIDEFEISEDSRTISLNSDRSYLVSEIITIYLTSDIYNMEDIYLDSAYCWNFQIESLSGTGEFSFHSIFQIGQFPWEMTSVDFDNNGVLDFAVTNQESQNLSVFLRNHNAPPTILTIPASWRPYSVVGCDVDNDFDLDLIYTDKTAQEIVIYEMNENDLFDHRATIYVGYRPNSITYGDIDSDGDLDLAVARFDDAKVSFFENTGDFIFIDKNSIDVGINPRTVIASDINADGLVDFLTANSGDNTYSKLINTMDFSFNVTTAEVKGEGPRRISTADMDGDGDLDVVVPNQYSGDITIFLNDGYGDLTGFKVIPLGITPESVGIADFDNDGDLDMVVPNTNSGSIVVLLNDGQAGYSAFSEIVDVEHPRSITVGDYNFDGSPDIAVINRDSQIFSIYTNDIEVNVKEFTALKEFTLSQNYPNPFNPTTRLDYYIPTEAKVRIDLYNSLGEKVQNLLNAKMVRGKYQVDIDGSRLSSGVYFVRINANRFNSMRKILLIK